MPKFRIALLDPEHEFEALEGSNPNANGMTFFKCMGARCCVPSLWCEAVVERVPIHLYDRVAIEQECATDEGPFGVVVSLVGNAAHVRYDGDVYPDVGTHDVRQLRFVARPHWSGV
jgi:hypothetical protein